jgi:hypothetical protein
VKSGHCEGLVHESAAFSPDTETPPAASQAGIIRVDDARPRAIRHKTPRPIRGDDFCEGTMACLRKVAAASAAFLLSSAVACRALTPLDSIDDWTSSSDSERLVLARTLALIAGQGRPEMNASFFKHCIEDVAAYSAAEARRINEVAAGCVFMRSNVFSESG